MMRTLRLLSFLACLAALAPSQALAVACSLTTLSSTSTQKVLACTNTSATTITLPSDWNPGNNSVEMIGAGQDGTTSDGTGGAGGGYAKKNNYSGIAGASVNIQVGGRGIGATTADSWFVSTSTVRAKGGGSASTNIGDVTHTGGAKTSSSTQGTGGGGAAGPSANGSSGTIGSSGTGGTGGQGDGTSGGTGGAATIGGNNGNEWATNFGSGGGGGGGNTTTGTGGDGGLFGAGGGGAVSPRAVGNGSSGIIVLSYRPMSSFIMSPAVIP